ncbi:MocR-like transcription factor YczR [Jatrophihabitans sp. DSM 45814]
MSTSNEAHSATPGRIGPLTVAGLIPDLAEQTGPRYRALSQALAALVLDGRLPAGARLPSERELARHLQISRATATAAYDDLAATGMLVRRQGSGSYLMLPAAARVTGPGARMARAALPPDTLDLSIASLQAMPGVIENATLAAHARLGPFTAASGYHPYGIEELREAVAQRYRARGVPTTAEHILITNGAQHGFDLILRTMVSPGDRVLTELPSYPGALEAIKAHSARAIPVPFGEQHAWDLEAIANTLQQTAPRLAYLIPDFHNPTGALVGTSQRRHAASAARRSGTRIVVDESFIDIDLRTTEEREGYERDERDEALGGSPGCPMPMAAIDDSVLSLGSLSKAIWGGLRIGWVRADPGDIQRLAGARALGDMSGAVIEQLVALHLITNPDDSIDRRRNSLRLQRDVLLSELSDQLPSWTTVCPPGGLSVWVELDAPAATPMTHLLEHRGVLISPGSRFAIDGALERFLRIPFALPAPQLVRAVQILAQTWGELDPRRLPRPDSSLIVA